MFSWFNSNKSDSAADLYMDLGTANTLISGRGQGILLNEPSLVAYMEPSPGKKKMVAVGFEAVTVLEKNPGNILAKKPVREGVIADFDLTQEMLRLFLTRDKVKKSYSRPRVVVSLPYGITEVEKRAVVNACKMAGASKVYLIDEPMAAAIGSGLTVKSPVGSMIIDIGGGTTEIAVIALADIVYCEGIRIAGHRIDEAIQRFFRDKKNLVISDITAEQVKIELGTAMPKKDIHFQTISGRDADSGLNRSVEVSSQEIGEAMSGLINEIVSAIHKALENTPPELVSDIIESGVVLAGGGALIKDLAVKIQNEVRLPVRVADEPLTALAKGGEIVLGEPELLEKITLDY